MKKIIVLSAVTALLISCLGKSYYEDKFVGTATFDQRSLENLADSVYFAGWFADNYLVFYNSVSEGKLKGGCAVSFKRDSSLVLQTVPAGKEYLHNLTTYTNPLFNEKQENLLNGCMVFFDNGENNPKSHCVFSAASSGTCTPQFCYVTNTQPVVKYFKEKNYPDKTLDKATADSVVLHITGYLNGAKTGDAKYVLASKDSVNVKWKSMSLTKLGNIDELKFSLEVNGSDDCLQYCCIDNIVSNVHIKQ